MLYRRSTPTSDAIPSLTRLPPLPYTQVSEDKYTFRAAGYYRELVVDWPALVDVTGKSSKFRKSKHTLVVSRHVTAL